MMSLIQELQVASEDGKRAFERGQYQTAADLFRSAAAGYTDLNDEVSSAEQRNNLSVALLKMGRAQEALDATSGTDAIFAGIGDSRRQGMALNNRAAAQESLDRLEEALSAYERAAALLEEAGEKELRTVALKAAAGIHLRRGRLLDTGMRMIGALESEQHPTLLERLLKFVLRLTQR